MGIFMYSYRSSGVSRYIFLMSAPPNLAPGVLMTLFHMILVDTMSAVRVVSSYGYSMRLPPTVMRTRLGSSFWGR